ncbi:MAG: SprB repeat-containing protein, partial [Bacteroidota bacterium]
MSIGGTCDASLVIASTDLIQVESNILMTNAKSFELQEGAVEIHGKAIATNIFKANNSHSFLSLSGSKIVVQETVTIHPNIQTDSTSELAFWLAEGTDESNSTPGPFHMQFSGNRTNTCATGAGETPFTIDAVVISDYNGQDISCNGAEDGEAFVTVVGGVGPFDFTWIGADGTAFTQNFPNLGTGTYTVVVNDIGQGINCVDNVQLTEPSPLTMFLFDQTPPSCSGICNGSATPTITGGMPGYDYDWSNGEQGSTASMLCEGPNQLIVTDQNGCVLVEDFQTDLDPIIANVTITPVLCNGTSTGIATSQPTGGDGSYSFSWSTAPDTDDTIENQPAGQVTLTITDGSGCSIDTTFTIEEEPPLDIVLDDLQDESCQGALDGSIAISVVGGTPNYDITWSGDLGFT